MALPLVPQDKANHTIYGAVFAVFVLAIVTHFSPDANLKIIPVMAALTIGILKELYDSVSGGDTSFWDAFATTCGGAAISASVVVVS